MPDIGEGVVEGEIIQWLKNVNDLVKQDEPVVVVMTDKATVELPSPFPGKIAKVYFKPGDIATCTKPLYDIEVADFSSDKLPAEKKESVPVSKTEPSPQKMISPSSETSCKGLATPPVRKLAKDMGIDLSAIEGTGKEGRVTIDDLKKSSVITRGSQEIADIPLIHLEGDISKPLVGIRHQMARRMALSKARIPHFSYFEEVDVTRLIGLRQKVKAEAEREGVHTTYMPFFLRALSLCIKEFPFLNSSYDEANHQIILHQSQNMGIATATSEGLIVPVLKNVEGMSLDRLLRAYHALRVKIEGKKMESSDFRDATITLSNFGVLGGHGLWATPIINYPQAAIVAFAKVQRRPIVQGDQVVIREMLNVSWSFDHRIIDGEMAAAISRVFCGYLQNPAPLL
jgi:pyruvate dehydrogenase E2 component (dihydrolipoamide acetyltransferase)/2-oxoisovalerate dehydrogenase E2 component (dihydrolipoyl transacylase)